MRELEATGHLDGYCIRNGGEVVGVFRTWGEAVDALKAAREASAVLMVTKPPATEGGPAGA